MAVLEGKDLQTVLDQCARIAFGKVTITLHRDTVVSIQTEETRRVLNRPRPYEARE